MQSASRTETWRTWEGLVVEGKFPLRQWLGGSDHSAVFLTEWKEQPSFKVVIKLIAQDRDQPELRNSRGPAAVPLEHPHLIRIFETGQCVLDRIPLVYVVMEQADEDLSQILPQRPLTPAETADLLPPVLDGLAYLHGQGLIHGRLKPSNVQAVNDQLKLSADQVRSIADAGARRGRRDVYDAPETAAGVVSPACDVWSLGVTLLAVLTQNVPEDGDAPKEDPLLPATMPEPFRGIVHECLHLDPQQRCSIADIRARLQPGANSTPAASPTAPAATPAAPYRTTWRILIPIAVLLIFGFGFVLFRAIFPSPSSQSGKFKIEVTPQASQPVPAPTTPESAPAAKKVSGSAGEEVRQVLPDISQSARRSITGTIKIKVRVDVDDSGKVTKARLASPVKSRYFADHTLEAAKAWEFSPPEVDGKPAESAWELQFRLQRSGTHASAQRLTR
jgi:TonB family protein